MRGDVRVDGYLADREDAARQLRTFRAQVRSARGFSIRRAAPVHADAGRRYELWHASWSGGGIASVEVGDDRGAS